MGFLYSHPQAPSVGEDLAMLPEEHELVIVQSEASNDPFSQTDVVVSAAR